MNFVFGTIIVMLSFVRMTVCEREFAAPDR